MRVWIDLTNSPHVLVLRPVVEDLRRRGHEVLVTARDFAQTVALAQRHGLDATVIGHHRGEGLAAKAVGLASRSTALLRWARGRGIDVALGHGSNDVTVAAAALRIPSATMFDYEWATVQHSVNCRLARTVVVPRAIPVERLGRYGAVGKIRAYEGLKEEYYLADLEPDEAVLTELGLDRSEPIIVIRTAPEVSLYHRHAGSDAFADVLRRVQGRQAVVLPRTPQQREELTKAGGFLVPERAIDAPSLIAFADLVVSAGGTMNREAVALGTPVYTTYAGRLGAVDERLIAEGRLRRLTDAGAIDLGRRPEADGPRAPLTCEAPEATPSGAVARAAGSTGRVRRDPRILTDLLLSAAAAAGD